jgi:hypothetical protein
VSRCHCHLGLSARSIAYSGHTEHPRDPADLRRCIAYCVEAGISDDSLRRRMRKRSPQWDALLPHWAELRGLLYREIETRTDGRAPATYERMRELLYGSAA